MSSSSPNEKKQLIDPEEVNRLLGEPPITKDYLSLTTPTYSGMPLNQADEDETQEEMKKRIEALIDSKLQIPEGTTTREREEREKNKKEERAYRLRVALLILLGLLLGGGIAATLVFFAAPVIGLIAVAAASLGLSTFGIGLLAIGIGALLGVTLLAVAENLRLGKDKVTHNYNHKQRQTYLRQVIFATLMLAGIGLGIFLAGAFPVVLGVFASVAGPGIIALALAGAAGLFAMGLLTSLIYAAVVIQYELKADEHSKKVTTKPGLSESEIISIKKSTLLEIIARHPLLFRVLLGAVIAAGIGALMTLVFPGALAAFALAVGLTVGSPLALVAAIGTVMLLSAAFGMSLLGFLEMRLIETGKKISNLQMALILIPATIVGTTLGIFLAATAFPILTFGLTGPAAFAIAGAIGLAASIVLAAVALDGIRRIQYPRTTKLNLEELDEPKLHISDMQLFTQVISTSGNGLWQEIKVTQTFEEDDENYELGDIFYYNTSENSDQFDKPDDYDQNKDLEIVIVSQASTEAKVYSGMGTEALTRRLSVDAGSGSATDEKKKQELEESYYQYAPSVTSQSHGKVAEPMFGSVSISDSKDWRTGLCTKAGQFRDERYEIGERAYFHNINKDGRATMEITKTPPSEVTFPSIGSTHPANPSQS